MQGKEEKGTFSTERKEKTNAEYPSSLVSIAAILCLGNARRTLSFCLSPRCGTKKKTFSFHL